jgi:hypothetical protein
MRGYRFMDARSRQISLRMMPVNGGHLRGKQGMTGVDRFAIMRQHAPHVVKMGHSCREMPQ